MPYNMKQRAVLSLGILLLVLAGNHTVLCEHEPEHCEPGYYESAGTIFSSCAPCVQGKYSETGTWAVCEPCEPGYSSEPGARSCRKCARGKYTSTEGQAPCLDCAVNEFSKPTVGGTECLSCAANERTYEFYDWSVTFTCTYDTSS